MNHIAETTKSTISIIQAHTLLAKALSNDSKPTPGYLFPEIAQLTNTPATCSVVLAQLLKTISPTNYNPNRRNTPSTTSSSSSHSYSSTAHVLLKAVKILRQLAQSGSADFRRSLARQGKGLLAELVGYRGSWDEVHGDRINNDVRTVTEDLVEYMHANPVQEPNDDDLEVSDSLTTREEAVLKNSTQDLQGFGNPEFETWSEDSDGDNASSLGYKKPAKVSKREPDDRPAPPLPGFGNPAFQKDNQEGAPTILTKLFDRIQDLTAPPPPIAMRAAYREQEQRRQKMYVGEYSLHGGDAGSRLNIASEVGTNPFKRTTRTQGLAAGGWSGGGARDGGGILPHDMVTNRAFPVNRPGTNSGGVQPRNETSAAVYTLAENAKESYLRLLNSGPPRFRAFIENHSATSQDGSGAEKEVSGMVGGVIGQIRDVVQEGIKQERQSNTGSSKHQNMVIAELLRDLNEWIESENWERRLKYLYVIDGLLTTKEINDAIMQCPVVPTLLQTLTGPRCLSAPQKSIAVLSSDMFQTGLLQNEGHLQVITRRKR
ncbi:AP-4 complex accessory subunit Tepsin [Podila epicladia]|nr:AP-4 complex accessory subunit Tepsin [Podila epicladia]